MFRQITIQGLGPHSNTVLDLDPRGTMDITGPSQAGKSMLLTALCWCLYGTDTDGRPLDASLLRDGEVLQVSVTTGKGTTFCRTRTGVTVTPPGLKAVRVTSQAALEPHLKALADAELARLILVPMAWLPLAHGPGDGRALRGFLARVLPGATAETLLNAELSDDEPHDAKGAERARRDARKLVDQLTGALAQAKAAPIGAEPVKPDAFKGLEAAALIARRDEVVQANKAVEADRKTWIRESLARDAAQAARANWNRRRSALHVPTQPRVPVTEAMLDAFEAERAANDATARSVEASRAAVNAYANALTAAEQWDFRAEGVARPERPEPTPEQVESAASALQELNAKLASRKRPEFPRGYRPHVVGLHAVVLAPPPARPRGYRLDPVAACPGVKKGCLASSRGEAEADRIAAEVEAEWVRHEETNAAREAAEQERYETELHNADRFAAEVEAAWAAYDVADLIPAPVADAHQETLALADAWRLVKALGQRPEVPPEPKPVQAAYVNAAQEAIESARAINAAWTAYEAAAAALGDEPADPAELRPMPVTQPVPEVPQWALDITRDHASYEARAADWRQRADKRDAEVKRLTGELADATTAADRSETVLELIRTAPGRALSAKLSTLGDLGPVRLEVSDDAITVLVDGRPWRAASTGRRIVADAWLRCALRKAVGMDWLPVVVDEAQSVGGMPIPTPVPGWILRTTASGSLQAVARG